MTDDLISRAEAIKALDALEDIIDDAVQNTRTAIFAFPSAQRTGKWIKMNDVVDDEECNGYKCSNCGEWMDYKSHFCPNCGARMVNHE